MATLVETPSWIGVYKLELEDKVEGGTPVFDAGGEPVSGWANAPLQHLTNRTAYLKAQVEALASSKQDLIPTGTTEQFYRGDKQFVSVTKANVGLGNVDNTSDANKPVSTATQNALNLKVNTSVVGVNSGVASLDSGGKVPASQMPSTDSVAEGSTNKYFTEGRAQDALVAFPPFKPNNWDQAYAWGNHATAGYESQTNKGQPNGYAPLNAAGKLPVDNVDGTWLGDLNYQGTWSPVTNSPALPAASSGNKGYYYIAWEDGTYAGNYYIAGDFVVSNGTAWQKVDQNFNGHNRLPKVKPTLLLDFANSKTVDPRITYACASPMPYYDGRTVAKAEENLLLNSASLATQTRAVTATAHTLSFSGTGTVTLTGASTAGPLVGTGPDRVVLSFTPTAGNLTLTVSGDVLEAQLEARSFATAYTPTTTQPITRYQPKLLEAPANVPTITHDPVTGETLGLQVYGQATNLLTRSDDFTNAEWVKTNVDPVSGVIAPDGTVSGSILRETTATGAHGVERSITVNIGETRTLLFVAKNFGRRYVTVSFAAVNLACFDLQEGTAVIGAGSANSVALTPTIRNLGNGLFLCAAKLTRLNTNLTATIEIRASRTLLTASTDSYTGDGTSGIYIWRAGLYAGDYAGPPIKTEGSQVTRADARASISTDGWLRQGVGAIYAEARSRQSSATAVVQLDDGTNSNRIYTAISTVATVPQQVVFVNGINVATVNLSSSTENAQKLAVSWGDGVFSADNSVGNSGQASLNQIPVISVMRFAANATTQVNAIFSKIAYYPTVMTATELEALTS